MLRGFSLWLPTTVAAALLPALCSFSGCSNNDSESGEGGDENSFGVQDTYDEGPDFCDSFDGAGSACAPISNALCFPVCEAGGCTCGVGPDGTGVWQCHTDLSCMPKCAPEDANCILDGGEFADTGPIPDSFVQPTYDAASETGVNDGGTVAQGMDAQDATGSDARSLDASDADAAG